MTNNSKTRDKPIWLLLLIPPLLFLLKDLIATMIVLSYEPGITAEAVHNYALELLPGSLFVVTGNAPALNLGFGVIIGALLYFGALYRRRLYRHVVRPERGSRVL